MKTAWPLASCVPPGPTPPRNACPPYMLPAAIATGGGAAAAGALGMESRWLQGGTKQWICWYGYQSVGHNLR